MFGRAQASIGGITGRIVWTAGAQGVNQLARIVQLFLLVPICLGAWGTAVYEDWLLINSVTAFLALGDLGLVQFTTVKLIDAWSKEERDRFSREWALALGLLAAMSAALACLLALFWAEPAWTSLIPSRQLDGAELATIAVLLALAQALSILIALGLAVYRARGDLSRSYHVSSILVVLQTAGVALPASFGQGPLGAAAGNCVVTLAMLAAEIVNLRLRYPDMRWRPAWSSFDQLWPRVRDACGYLVSPVTTTIMVNGPTLILANAGAPQGAIALFTATRTIAGVARQLPYQFAHPAGVELAGMLARGDRNALSRVYASASLALATIVGGLSGITVVVAPLVMTLWTRGHIRYDPYLTLILVGETAICAPAQVAYTLLWYGGYPRPLNKALFASTGVAMGLAALLAPWFGVRGVAAGVGVGEIAGVAVYLSLLADRVIERKPGSGLLRNLGTTLLAFASSTACAYLLFRLIGPHGWIGMIGLGFAFAVVAATGVYWILLNGLQRARVTAAATAFVQKNRPPVQARAGGSGRSRRSRDRTERSRSAG